MSALLSGDIYAMVSNKCEEEDRIKEDLEHKTTVARSHPGNQANND